MNEPSTSPIIMGLLFVLRCLIPLGILFGISYLLRRLELVVDQVEEEEVESGQLESQQPTSQADALPVEEPLAPAPVKKPKSVKKKKPATPKKKES
ncbi:MAG TPA: hypothetical protein PKL78_11310 [Anaerolineales bacterium]|nr:hypothetical protein [Anaerolineales bacterium]